MSDIKGLIFDYGGTIDSRGIHWSEVIWDGYRQAPLPVTKEQFRDAYVFAERELARTKSSVDEARMVLAMLYDTYPIVLVSNFYGNIEAVLTDFGIKKYFDKIVESAVVGVRKPDPKIFTLGVEALGMKAENVLVVGDSYTKDIVPALEAGCQAVWLKGKGWTDKEDSIQYPDTIVKLSDLLECGILKN